MVEFRTPTQDESDQIAVSVSRAGLRVQGRLEISVERQGRFTVVVLEYLAPREGGLFKRVLFTGAARLDTHDPDDPDIGRRVALAKACQGLVKWLKAEKSWSLSRPGHPGDTVDGVRIEPGTLSGLAPLPGLAAQVDRELVEDYSKGPSSGR